MMGFSNDRASICDEYINPLYASVPGCTDSREGVGDGYSVNYDPTSGHSGSLGLGLLISSRFSLEVEYYFANASYNQTAYIGAAEGTNITKLENELVQSEERLGNMQSSSFYANTLLSLTDQYPKWIPYIGIGAGFSSLSAGYSSIWARNTDPSRIKTGDGQPNADEIKNNLAGTLSSALGSIQNTVLSWKAFGWIDYRISEKTFLTFKVQYTGFGKLETTKLVWDPLRSHPPNLRKDGSEPVTSISGFSNVYLVSAELGIRYTL
ncbi:MAG: hypothetical protein OXI05_02420 [Bacteroidota bacterium]|nr:hypothetical protein [Bacteroidota bacterium]MXW14945.1 hypothetical protein [Rhodothermaceae bacterium]MDE2644680.1 hypothetical protein [Bacteroidota bacterium]MXZ17054.1 hypothetical protein [Rhodothermaceae bacterium]MYC03476.1 hypothetical protein [Rhodothermaceae bacterium]